MSQSSVEIVGPDSTLEVEVPGQRGAPGLPGPPGTEPDMLDLTVLFENSLL
jgi:hypothetical protein